MNIHLNTREINILRAKLQWWFNSKWYGYLTTKERLYILQRIHKRDEWEERDLINCRECIAHGEIDSRSFYFKSQKNLDHILPKLKFPE